MKKLIFTLALATISSIGLMAQDMTTVEAKNSDISDNLDLEAVASLFADAENLEEFENQLNDPDKRISNLDLNEDGYVDYLRVLENADENARLITIQAVVGKDLFQDVATIDVEIDDAGQTRVQVVGDVYMYGSNYIVEPVYVSRPRIFVYLWGPRINYWHSPYYWGYYPSYWSFWAPVPYYSYHRHVFGYRNYSCHYRAVRYSRRCATMNRGYRRNDYGRSHPKSSFAARNKGYVNRTDYSASRPKSTAPSTRPVSNIKNSGNQVTKDWKPASAREGKPSNVKGNKVTVPNTRPVSKGNQSRPVEKGGSNTSTRPSSTTQSKEKPRTNTRPAEQTRPRETKVNNSSSSSKVNRPSQRTESRPKQTKPKASPSSRSRTSSKSQSSRSKASTPSRPKSSGSTSRPSSSRSSNAGKSSRSSGSSSKGRSSSSSSSKRR